MSFRLFREEEDLVAAARKVLDGGQFDDAEARTRFEDLLQGCLLYTSPSPRD